MDCDGNKLTYILALFFLLLPQWITTEVSYNFVIWNVGQGSWATFVNQDQCLHFDMGGDRLLLKPVIDLCRNKDNQIYLTHEDWDHVNGIRRFSRDVKSICLFYPHPARRGITRQLKPCQKMNSRVRIISYGHLNSDRNAASVVYVLANRVLISGDAPISEEKRWVRSLPQDLLVLLLGHHGSVTSTSETLLKWTQPRMAIASARKKRYGHPHWKVQAKLKKYGVPLLTTETLGSIYLQVPVGETKNH
jgi:competence protein ComEC